MLATRGGHKIGCPIGGHKNITVTVVFSDIYDPPIVKKKGVNYTENNIEIASKMLTFLLLHVHVGGS